jgi:sugar lactone lactonase YvrE
MAYRTLILLLVAAIFTSCARKITTGSGSDEIVIYPAPPDTARIQFLTRISSSQDITGSQKSFSRFIFGQDENYPISKPYGAAFYKGKIWICDTYIHGLDIIDMEKNRFEQFIPSGRGELKVPLNCYIDAQGKIYISDTERKQVVIYDETGKYISCFGNGTDFKPVDVVVHNDRIYVSNLSGHQINVFTNDSAHELINAFPEVNKSNPESLFSPTNLAVTDSCVYVTDFGDFRIKVYSPEGEFIRAVGSYGQNLGQFIRPKGIAIDRESNLYVVDAGFENVQIFDPRGNLLMFFGGNYKGPGDMWLPAKVTLDYDHVDSFRKFVSPEYNLKYVILVTNQFGPDKINIYGAVEPFKPGMKAQGKSGKTKKGQNGPMFVHTK